MTSTTAYSPLDPVIQADPYPYYEELRRGPAATYLPADDLWVVPHFEHVWQVARVAAVTSKCAYRLLDPVMGLFAAHNGYNNFKLPHSGIRSEMRA